jgi:hypothetical protein
MGELIVSKNQLPTIKEGVVKGMEIAAGAKSSATYYHKREDQVQAIQNSVSALYAISKELPLILAAQKGVTGFFIQEVILNELSKGETGGACNIVNPQTWYDDKIGSRVLNYLVHQLDSGNGITYVLRMFDSLRKRKINNSRSRKMVQSFILGHDNLEFIAVKYRSKLKSILQHAYGNKKMSALSRVCGVYASGMNWIESTDAKFFEKEISKFSSDPRRTAKLLLYITGDGNPEFYSESEFPVISQFFKAKSDVRNCPSVPTEVLEGLLSDKSHPQYKELWSNESKRKSTQKMLREMNKTTTANQAIRQTKKNEELGVTKEVDMSKVSDFLALYKTGYETDFSQEILDAIDKLAEKRKFGNFMYRNIGIVLDRSASMTGHKVESKNTPRAIADFTMRVLQKSVDKCDVSMTSAGAGTDLATSFLDLVGDVEYDAVFILSDGYENSYEGLFNEVLQAWRELSQSVMPVYHISPITGAEMNAQVRSLGSGVSTLAINKPESMMLQLSSKLLEQDIKAWLQSQVNMLEAVTQDRRNRVHLI